MNQELTPVAAFHAATGRRPPSWPNGRSTAIRSRWRRATTSSIRRAVLELPDGQIYFASEENGDEGRDFRVTADGLAQQLPRLGLFSWENYVVGLNEGDTTYIQGQVDAGPTSGQLHVYVGHKLRRGNAFDRAGLTNGRQFVVDVAERDCEHRRAVPHHVREERPVTTEGGRGATRHLTAAAWGG